jgi:chitodextrinase
MNKERIIRGLRAIGKAQKVMTDEQALECADLYPEWSGEGNAYTAGDRVVYNDKLYKCLQSHTSQLTWTPTAAPSLWAEILPGQDGTDIGEWVQPDSTNPYMKGDRVTHNGKTWESTIDGNVWEPGAPGVYTWIEVNE